MPLASPSRDATGRAAARRAPVLRGATGPPTSPVARAGAVLAVAALASFVVVALVVARSDGHDRWDVVVRHDLLRHPGGIAAAVGGAAADLTSPAVLAVALLVAVVVLWRGAHRPLLGAAVLTVATTTAALVQLLALAFSGVRPSSLTLLGLPVFDGSFPSVRTAEAEALWGALVLAGLLVVRRRGVRALLLLGGMLLSAAIVCGQLDRNPSWPTDVLGGWLLGVLAVGVAATLLAAWPTATLGRPAQGGPSGTEPRSGRTRLDR